ncbi:MAG: amidase [Dehalococcoidia bacterium]
MTRTPPVSDLTTVSAAALARAIRDKQVSSREAVEAHLRRIEAVNPKLNAVAVVDGDRALSRARELDDALARGENAGPLHGVPFTVKDWIEVAGVPCAAGIEARRNFIPKHDATVVERMRSAGGVFLGKTIDNAVNRNAVYGSVANPYDVSRTPGESSSGEAAIIAAGGSPVGLGSDSGGSLRYPAHCCGIATLKPTAGRVPLTGHFARIDVMNDPRTQIGPLARDVDDLALVLPIIAGPDGRDAGVVPVPLEDWTRVDLRGLRVATFSQFEASAHSAAALGVEARKVRAGAIADADTVAAVERAAGALRDAGASIEERLPPRIEESWDITQMHWRRVRSYSWSEWRTPQEHVLTANEIEHGLFAWGRLQRAFLAFMQTYDLIVCPAAPSAAQLRADVSGPEPFIYTLPFSLSGQPVAVVRAGTSPEGLPIGVQVVASRWLDDVALAAALQIETALGGWPAPELA